jgi:hypothetical protein
MGRGYVLKDYAIFFFILIAEKALTIHVTADTTY